MDGIFAVAMTLLVIELELPDATAVAVPADLLRAVAHQIPTFIAWSISFLVLAIFWVNQQRLFHFVRTVDETLTWLVIGYLALVSLMPFTPALVGMLQDRGLPLPTSMGACIAGSGALVIVLIWLGPETRGRLFTAES